MHAPTIVLLDEAGRVLFASCGSSRLSRPAWGDEHGSYAAALTIESWELNVALTGAALPAQPCQLVLPINLDSCPYEGQDTPWVRAF